MRMNSPDTCNQQKGATWGLVRTSERALRIDGDYKYLNLANGKGVTAYVIDTGIYLQHDEFKGRAKWGTNTVDNDNSDGNGHGTHVAGTIGGTTYGLAKEVDLVAVKVLSAEGTGSTAGVIAGVEWTANNHKVSSSSNIHLLYGIDQRLFFCHATFRSPPWRTCLLVAAKVQRSIMQHLQLSESG